jgi:hypothetical protein
MALPFKAFCAAGKVSISCRVNHGCPGFKPAGTANKGVAKLSLGRRCASNIGS